MKLPAQKKVLKEDLKGSPDWVNPLIDTVNSFMEDVYQSLNKNITFQDNIASFIREFTYTTVTGYPLNQLPLNFMNTLRTPPIGLMVLQAYEKASYLPAPGPVYVPWTNNSGTITIGTITGLEEEKTYLIRILIL